MIGDIYAATLRSFFYVRISPKNPLADYLDWTRADSVQ